MFRRSHRAGGRRAQSAAELYNAGNAASRAGHPRKAIRAYTAALEADPLFAEAYHNRGVAYAEIGDEDSCIRDLMQPPALEYDREEYWQTYANHLGLGAIGSLVVTTELSEAYRQRIASRLRTLLQQEGRYVREFPEAGVRFDDASLLARAVFADWIRRREEPHPEVLRGVFTVAMDPDRIGDPEFAWRARFLLATVFYWRFQTTEWSTDGFGGVFFDTDFLDDTPLMLGDDGVEALDAEVVALTEPPPGEARDRRFARVALGLTLEAAESLLALRVSSPPAPRAASLHWALTQDLFKILMAAAAFLEDDDALARGISLSRRLNAAFSAAQWCQGRHDPSALIDKVLPHHEPRLGEGSKEATVLAPATVAIQFFIYETGGDNLLRMTFAEDESSTSYTYIHPPDVRRLVSTGRQWQDPAAYRGLQGTEGIDDLSLLLTVSSAMDDVPAEGYGAWLDELLLEPDFESRLAGASRLVVLPFNYLHNLPYQHVPTIRRLIDDGVIRELVLSPSLELTRRLAVREPAARDNASCLFVGINSAEVDAGAEYEIVRSEFEQTECLLDGQATREAITEAASRHDVVHIACHGEFDVSRNTPYLALTDDRLYPVDVALIPRLGCDSVVLNACISGVVSREGRNGDQSLGLATALLYGGARQVIATLWQLEADAALHFASDYYTRWRDSSEATVAAIVLDAQRALRDRYPTDVFSWGAHTVFGDWR